MSLAVGDISKLDAFKELVSNMRVILKFMAQTYLAPEFKHIRTLLGIARGLEQIVKTRFGSLAWAALSLRRNLPALRKLVGKCGTEFDFNGKKALLTPGDSRSIRFELELTKFVAVTEPIARAIKCLESPNTNPADVCTFWFALVAHYNRLLKSDALEIPDPTKETIRGIVRSRFVDAIIKAPKNVYLTAFYLDPRNRDAPIWLNTNPLEPVQPRIRISVENHGGSWSARQPVGPSASTHDGIYNALVEMLGDLYGDAKTVKVLMERVPELNGMPPHIAIDTLEKDYDSYKARDEPYDERFCKDDTPAKWWKRVQAGSQTVSVIGVLASRIFASTATSMADERTASQVTMLNSAHRAGLSLGTIKEMIQIKQYHRQKESTYTPSVSNWRVASDVLSSRTAVTAKELDQALSSDNNVHEIDLDDDDTVSPEYDDGLDDEDGDDDTCRTTPAQSHPDKLVEDIGIDFESPILLDVLDETPAGTSNTTPAAAKASAQAKQYSSDAWQDAGSFDWKAAARRK
ncbi:hypothetical protein PENSPDRAFT_656783 [Peniophora sp. CONT]|nr:hypothetical protein PENSPDRAFT_658737 [Peniophora sp. CONT]KZV61972.1 hypothetical protein PENSPDRAFT_658506 [Peniophora sp. CONT]KZV64192.1 hypothetical protein PENSPDRAFT_656783 [Peniophora sp. CONT]